MKHAIPPLQFTDSHMPRKATAKPPIALGRKRTELIRHYVTQMRALLDERNYCNVRIRDLHTAIRKELGIPRDDFIAAMRLQSLASENREQTVANIRDVLAALGSVMPAITAEENEP
jgi:hypothetical protein